MKSRRENRRYDEAWDELHQQLVEEEDVGPYGLKIVRSDVHNVAAGAYEHARRARGIIKKNRKPTHPKDPVEAIVINEAKVVDELKNIVGPGILKPDQVYALLCVGNKADEALQEPQPTASLFMQGYSLYINTLNQNGRLPEFSLDFHDIWDEAFYDDESIVLQLITLQGIARDCAPALCELAADLTSMVSADFVKSSSLPAYDNKVRMLAIEAGVGLAYSQCFDLMESCRNEVLSES